MTVTSNNRDQIKIMVLAAMFLALTLILPFLTAQIPQIGKMLCPMHFPVLLCGFFCGPVYGLLVGIAGPLLRSLIFGMPAIMPDALVMTFELGSYGFLAGFLYRLLPGKKLSIYLALLAAMLGGRIIWGICRIIVMGLGYSEFSGKLFITIGFVNALPGILLQIIFIPLIVMTSTHKGNQYAPS